MPRFLARDIVLTCNVETKVGQRGDYALFKGEERDFSGKQLPGEYNMIVYGVEATRIAGLCAGSRLCCTGTTKKRPSKDGDRFYDNWTVDCLEIVEEVRATDYDGSDPFADEA